jgi:alpha-L-arabinofuranosidase
VQDGRGWSMTKFAASTEKLNGTNDWTYVEVVYQALPDAKSVNVFARRAGNKGPLSGKAYFKDVRLEKFVPSVDMKIPYLSVNASKNADGSMVYLMVINKNMDSPMTSTIDLKDFAPAAKGNAWVLNGPSVDATNEKKHDNVKVTHKTFEITGSPFEFIFEPHSLTAIEIEGNPPEIASAAKAVSQ